MIWQIIKKQALILLRNPRHLALLIALPILLIIILGISLKGIMDEEIPVIDIKIALLEKQTESEQIAQFKHDLEKSDLPKEEINQKMAVLNHFQPITELKEEVFASIENIELITVSPTDKEKIKKDNSYTALIEVPEKFTYQLLEKVLLDYEEEPALQVYQNESSELGAGIVKAIVEKFQEQLTLGYFLGEKGLNINEIEVEKAASIGEVETINQREPVNTKGYYTVGMAVMNVMFIATMIGFYAFEEKQMHAFDRVILANVSRWNYFYGIFCTGMLFGFLQLLIIFAFSWLIFDVTWPNLFAFFIVTFAYATAIGGLAVFLTAISYRINSESIIDIFSSVIVYIMSLLGGSFFPIGDFSSLIQRLGTWTPNGAGMTAYLQILRGESISAASEQLYFLFTFAFVLIIVAAISFPKRGKAV